jgi:hypothetical protein
MSAERHVGENKTSSSTTTAESRNKLHELPDLMRKIDEPRISLNRR